MAGEDELSRLVEAELRLQMLAMLVHKNEQEAKEQLPREPIYTAEELEEMERQRKERERLETELELQKEIEKHNEIQRMIEREYEMQSKLDQEAKEKEGLTEPNSIVPRPRGRASRGPRGGRARG